MNILVVIVYWPLLYTVDMNRPEIKASVLRQWIARTTHTLPFFSVVTNFYLSDIVMKKSHGVFLLPIAIAYSLVNYSGCRYYNGTIYWFLDWGKPTVYLVLVALMAFGVGIHIFVAGLTIRVKGKKNDKTDARDQLETHKKK